MRISVDDAGHIDLRIPLRCRLAEAEQFVQKHQDWILQQREQKAQAHQQKSQSIALYGENLQIVPAPVRTFELADQELQVPEHWSSEETIARTDKWLREYARADFQKRIDQWWPGFSHLSKTKPTLRVKVMKTRWGSLSTRGYINLNRSLIHLQPEFIDLVVVHELCHLKHFDHGPGFQSLLASFIPDAQKLNRALNQVRFTGYSLDY
ncbi:MAG: M48 family metallopeptidase [Oceanobacter sp.]